MALSQKTSVTNQISPMLVDRATLRDATKRVEGVDDEEAQVVVESSESGSTVSTDDQRAAAVLRQELLERWERLAAAGRRARAVISNSAERAQFTTASDAELINWLDEFGKELEYVQAAR